jgi:hypothetical protein
MSPGRIGDLSREPVSSYHPFVPNTLIHFATQGLAARLATRADARLVYLGCLLPDLPWILRRGVVGLDIPVDTFDLRLYTMAQASLAGTLWLAAALAALTASRRMVFALLGSSALLHLLLDAVEIKWGNGVHLLAPLSWRMTSFDLVPGEGVHVLVLSVAGALLLCRELLSNDHRRVALAVSPRRLAAAAAFAAAYLVTPLLTLGSVEASDSYSVKTLREVEARPGRRVSLDRTALVATEEGRFLELWTGERVRATGAGPSHSARISLHGTFLASGLLRIDEWTEHRHSRDWPSYVALVLLALLWVRPPSRGGQPPYSRATCLNRKAATSPR